MVNLKSMYKELVESNLMENLPTFSFSQDHLESFFGRIRSRHGFNDNPNVQQFCGAFRRIIVNQEIRSSRSSNCQDHLNILTVSSRRLQRESAESNKNLSPILTDSDDGAEFDEDKKNPDQTELMQECEFLPDDLEKTSVAYMAGLIEKKILTQAAFNCPLCRQVFSVNDKIAETLLTGTLDSVQVPCQTTFDICYISNTYLKILARDAGYTYEKLFSDIWRQMDIKNAYAKTNFEGHEEHKEFFIKIIIEEFVRKQANCIAKEVTRKEKGLLMRHFLNKQIHRSGH